MKCSNCGFETLEKINFCPVCATQINQSTPEVYQTLEGNQTSQSTDELPTESQMQSDNYIFTIKDWFVGNLVLLVIASLATITSCCINIFALASLILSIIGVVYSNKVKNNIFIKKYDQAIRDSKTAKILFFISLGIIIFSVLVIIVIIVSLMVIVFSANNYLNIYN